MLGRLCSEACAGLFERQRVAAEEPPQPPDAHSHALLSQSCLDLGQLDVAFSSSGDRIAGACASMRAERRSLSAVRTRLALLASGDATGRQLPYARRPLRPW